LTFEIGVETENHICVMGSGFNISKTLSRDIKQMKERNVGYFLYCFQVHHRDFKGKVNLNFEQVISTKQFRFNFIYSYMSQRRECVTKVVPKICHSQIDFPSYFSCTDSIFIFPS